MSAASDQLQAAIALACRAHDGQRYPSRDSEPYVQHLFRVMQSVRALEAQTVAILHDVLEDTPVTVDDLREVGLSNDIVEAIVAVTRSTDQTYEQYIEQVARDDLARIVKLADHLANNKRLDRTSDVVARIGRYQRAIDRLQVSRR